MRISDWSSDVCSSDLRTTTSARADSQSTILPLPSSPHCEPMTTTFVIAFPSSFGDSYACGRAQNACRHNLLRREGAYAYAVIPALGGLPPGQAPFEKSSVMPGLDPGIHAWKIGRAHV